MRENNNSETSLPGFHTTSLDAKDRCSFPTKLRENTVARCVYIFYSSRHKRAFAVFDKEILREKFPSEFDRIPLSEMQISNQWKLYIWCKFFEKHGIEGMKQGSPIFFRRTVQDSRIIEIHFSYEHAKESAILQNEVADNVADILLSSGGKHLDFSASIMNTSSCFALHTPPNSIPTSTFTVSF